MRCHCCFSATGLRVIRLWPYDGAMPSKPLATSGVPAFNLRLPRDLRQQVVEAAHANSHSINAEIIHRLRRSFEGYRR
jgi:predicted HicB family RNase H-like nuclease